MKVLYDHQIFEMQKFGGISRYFSELIKTNPSAKLALKYTDNLYFDEDHCKLFKLLPKNEPQYDNFLFGLNFKGRGRLFRCYKKIRQKNNISKSINYLNKLDFDVFHPTYYNTYFLQYLKNKPFVLTVHDMIHEIFVEEDQHTIINKKKLILQSNKIITISENTKKDIVKFFPEINEEKISVVYLASSFPLIEQYEEKGNYILYTGNRDGYKNFNNLIKAIAPLLIKYNFRLICTGSSFYDTELQMMKNLNISDRVLCNKFTSEDELIALYSKASIFVFPSLYEGFGIPILEAFATGCPALLSNTSSLPEIGGNAAVYFDPYSIDDMRIKIENVLTSTALQKELIKKGKERVKQFSWKKCAQETVDVYKKIIYT